MKKSTRRTTSDTDKTLTSIDRTLRLIDERLTDLMSQNDIILENTTRKRKNTKSGSSEEESESNPRLENSNPRLENSNPRLENYDSENTGVVLYGRIQPYKGEYGKIKEIIELFNANIGKKIMQDDIARELGLEYKTRSQRNVITNPVKSLKGKNCIKREEIGRNVYFWSDKRISYTF